MGRLTKEEAEARRLLRRINELADLALDTIEEILRSGSPTAQARVIDLVLRMALGPAQEYAKEKAKRRGKKEKATYSEKLLAAIREMQRGGFIPPVKGMPDLPEKD